MKRAQMLHVLACIWLHVSAMSNALLMVRFVLVCVLLKLRPRLPPLAVVRVLLREVGPLALPWSYLLSRRGCPAAVLCTAR